MYRRSEYQMMNLLCWASLICAFATLFFLGVFVIQKVEAYRNLALILMVFSFFFQIQVFMYKLTVMERRMLHLVGVGEQHFVIAEKRAHLHLVFFFIFFWLILLGVIFAFLVPLNG